MDVLRQWQAVLSVINSPKATLFRSIQYPRMLKTPWGTAKPTLERCLLVNTSRGFWPPTPKKLFALK
jgi:hypothetical protein